MNTQQVMQLAFQHLNSGNLGAAAQLFNSVLQQEPHNFAALNGRGFVALQQNALPQAQADLQSSLSINPKQPFAQKMLGIVLGAMGHFDAAMQAFAAALALDVKDPEIYFNRANFRFQAGQVQDALADLDAAIKLKGSYLEARSNRANLFIHLGEFARAEKDLDYLVAKVTNNPNLWVALGLVRQKVGKHQSAMQCNERALKIESNHPDALLNGATVLFEAEDYSRALDWIVKAEKHTPDRPEVYYTKGNILAAISKFDEAIGAFDHAINLRPDYVQALNSRGLAYSRIRNMPAAIENYDLALKLDPSFHDALYNKCYFQLEHGEFSAGWLGYEHRFDIPGFGLWKYDDFPKWDGSRLNGTLLIRAEQGLGDQMLFASVLPDIEKLTSKIALQFEPRLVSLFQRSFPNMLVLSFKDPLPADVVAQATLGSLPRFCRNSLNDFQRGAKSYLVADQERTDAYRRALCVDHKFHVGVSWFSKTKLFTRQKSLGLEQLKPISDIEGVDLIDLQYGDMRKEKAAAVMSGLTFNSAVDIDLTNDIDGLASLISACDVVVTVSNTTAHIAAALGKPVLVMLPYRIGKLWYWSDVLSPSGSIWYPTVKTFHQESPEDWRGTITDVVDHLKMLVANHVSN